MITGYTNTNNAFALPVRDIKAKLEIWDSESQALVLTCFCEDRIKSFTVERVGDESKFFGFGICQRLNIKLIDMDRELALDTNNYCKVFLQSSPAEGFIQAFPLFHISEQHRNEVTGELSITAYDLMYPDKAHLSSDVIITPPYTLESYIQAAAIAYGADGYELQNVTDYSLFNLSYLNGASLDGTETLRDTLNAIAELTGTIFYIDYRNKLVFKKITGTNNTPVLDITKADYISCNTKTNRRLCRLVVTNELGDNYESAEEYSGTTQYIRDNPFLATRNDVANVVDSLLAQVAGSKIGQFHVKWRGNFLLEIGDYFNIHGYEVEENNDVVQSSYLVNDTLTFDGGLSQTTQWEFINNNAETETNPTNLGDILKQTYARVDKANREIELVASNIGEIDREVSTIKLDTQNIVASVESVVTATDEAIESMNNSISTITNKVQASMSAEQVNIAINSALNNGVNSVATSTGFTFNDEGLSITKSDSEINTIITENGMTVYKNNEAVLVADNEGVKAQDLHATTFLIIGMNSRFEDYDNGRRTGCFWIGGSN